MSATGGKPEESALCPTYCSGSRAKVCNGTGGKRLLISWPVVSDKEKSQLRKQARRNRRALSEGQRREASLRICARIAASKSFRNAERIALYLPLAHEVDCLPLLEYALDLEKQVFLPQLPGRYPRAMDFARLDARTVLESGPIGTTQPCRHTARVVPPRQIDLVITPLVAFDSSGHRIGMGAGYYDRVFSFLRLRQHWIRPRLLGVAFDCQLVPEIAVDSWDVPLWSVVTESTSYPASRIF